MTNFKEENQLELIPATADDFEYFIQFTGSEIKHPIIIRNIDYLVIWQDCSDVVLVDRNTTELWFSISENPNYVGNKS